MISSFSISNYKNYLDFKIPLSRITLLGGRNNVGKTNFLEALFMVHDRFNPQMVLRQFGFRGLNEMVLDPTVMWGPIFSNYNMEKEISFSAIRNGKKEDMKISYNPTYTRTLMPAEPSSPGVTPQIRTDQKARVSAALDMSLKVEGEKVQTWHLLVGPDGMGVHVDYGTIPNRKAVILSSSTRINPTEDAVRFGELDILGQQDSVIEFLKLIEPRLRGLSSITTGRDSIIYGDIGIGRKIPIPFMGDGLARLLSIVLAILTSKSGIILIDEIENGIHYSVMPQIWEGIARAAIAADVQIVATTHSYECLQAALKGLNNDISNEFSYIRLERKYEELSTKVFSYEKLAMALQNEWEVR